jgi:hypothetical protein
VFRRLVKEYQCELKVKANNDHAFIIERDLDINSYLSKLGMDRTYSTSVMFMSLAQLAERPIVVLLANSRTTRRTHLPGKGARRGGRGHYLPTLM